MDRLVIVRHGEAASAEPGEPDAGRPLTPHGERDAHAAGRWLAAQGFPVDRILCSPARRARATARHLLEGAGIDPDRLYDVDLLYGADAPLLAKIIEEEGAQVRTLMVIGHNPGLQDLVRRLVPDAARGGLQPGGVVVVHVQQEPPAPGSVVLEDSWFPLGPG